MNKFFPVLILGLFIAFGGVIANGQSQAAELTWNEVKTLQNAERISMENRQKDELEKLQEAYKLELEAVRGNTGPIARVSEQYSQNRLELSKIHSDERRRITEIHAEERKAFFQNKPSK